MYSNLLILFKLCIMISRIDTCPAKKGEQMAINYFKNLNQSDLRSLTLIFLYHKKLEITLYRVLLEEQNSTTKGFSNKDNKLIWHSKCRAAILSHINYSIYNCNNIMVSFMLMPVRLL